MSLKHIGVPGIACIAACLASWWMPMHVSAAVPGQRVSVRDFGAKCDSTNGRDGTDDTAAIQAALNALTIARALFFPATGTTFCKVTSTLRLPKFNGISIYGEGRRTSRIAQVTPGADLFDTANDSGENVNGLQIRDMTLQGLNGARYGLRLVKSSRASARGVRFTGFTAGAGIYTKNSISLTVDDSEFDSNRDGMFEDGGSEAGSNGFRVTNSYFASNARYGINVYSCFAWSVTHSIMESNSKGGFRCGTAGGALAIDNVYFEENRDGSPGTFDIYIGVDSFVRGGSIRNSYFNGRAANDRSDYYPIRLGYVLSFDISHNFVNVGNRFLRFETPNVADTMIGPQAYSDVFVSKDSNTVYGNIPRGFVNARNVLRDGQIITLGTR